ncbi:MAG: choice-of-anchor Q domain-containing protein, partial [Rudaea sp.]
MESKLLRPLSQAVALALAAGGAHAASITVTDGGDAGTPTTCTLRQAIASANTDSAQGSCPAGSGADTITFAPALANSTIALQYGQLLVYSSVTISGSGQTIQAARNSRVMSINHYGNTAPTVNLTDLTLTGGNYSGPGAGLAISYSTAPLRPVTRQQRHVSQRKAPTPPPSYAPIVSLDQVTISNNTSNVTAGGLFIDAATVTVNQSTISGNSLTAPTSNQGAGGVFITSTYYYGYGSAVTVTDSTISGNSVSGSRSYETGGVYVYGSSLSLTNSTIAANSASGNTELAGGLSVRYYGAAAVVNNSTITGNTVNSNANVVTGGILVGAGYANLGLYNTILSANQIARLTAPTIVAVGQPDMFVANGSNVIAQSNLMGSALSGGFTGNGNVFSDAPGLGTLANNGGPTLTMKPQPGSPTLGAGDIALIPAGI